MPSPNPTGNDLFCELISTETQQNVPITYWDFWMIITLVNDFAEDWDRLGAYFHERAKTDYSLRNPIEGYQSHLHHLQQQFEENGLSVNQVLAQASPELLKKHKVKAKSRFIDFKSSNEVRSYWMIHTPRRLLEQRSLRGFWDAFPVSPENYAGLIEALYKPKGFYSENQSWVLQRKLSRFLETREKKLNLPERFGLYRAFFAVVLEQMDRVDNSFGVIAQLYDDVIGKYVDLDRSFLSAHVFWQDLLNLLIWEDDGFTNRQQPYILSNLTHDEIRIAEEILQKEREELRQYELEYQAEEALTLLGLLYTQQRMLAHFIPTAKVMGTRAWQRITRMAEMAESQGEIELALAVYEACFQPGIHEQFLREKYEQLKQKYQSE